MKTKTVIISLLIISMGIGSIYAQESKSNDFNTTDYGYPDAAIITFDKDSYELGDVIFIEYQMIDPWTNEKVQLSGSRGLNNNYGYIDDNGYGNYTQLIDAKSFKGQMSYQVSYNSNDDPSQFHTSESKSIVNSDILSVTIDSFNNIKYINSTMDTMDLKMDDSTNNLIVVNDNIDILNENMTKMKGNIDNENKGMNSRNDVQDTLIDRILDELGMSRTPPTPIELPTDDIFCGKPASRYNMINGTDGRDVIFGTSLPDLIFAFEGNDFIRAVGPNDCIYLGAGNDFALLVNSTNTIIYGGSGDDSIRNNGNGTVYGESGNDTLYIRNPALGHLLNGGNGIDICTGDSGVSINKVNCEI